MWSHRTALYSPQREQPTRTPLRFIQTRDGGSLTLLDQLMDTISLVSS